MYFVCSLLALLLFKKKWHTEAVCLKADFTPCSWHKAEVLGFGRRYLRHAPSSSCIFLLMDGVECAVRDGIEYAESLLTL